MLKKFFLWILPGIESEFLRPKSFLEKNLSVFKQLIENTQNFSNSDLKCLNLDCIDYLKQTEKKFDIIFF
jgi:hypothetical protein